MKPLFAIPALVALASTAVADLDINDSSIILLHQFNEQTSGNIDNLQVSPDPFVDTAVTGTAQNHEDFGDGDSDGPAWGGGAAFTSGASAVGTGTGLIFDAGDNDHTRYSNWLATSQGNYSNGQSFTLMMRINTDLPDNTTRGLNAFGSTSNYLELQGGGSGVILRTRLREGVGGGETSFYYSSVGTGGIDNGSFVGGPDTAAGGGFVLDRDEWNNVFLIYEADTSITLAIDDGTTFSYITTNAINDPGFDTTTNGFADAGINGVLASLFVSADNPSTLGTLIESQVVWDRALSISEADAIGLSNVPEPATFGLLAVGSLCLIRRRAAR